MMVTASCNDDQGSIRTKASSLSPLLSTLEGKGGPLKEKVGAYLTLSERLKSDKDASVSREVCRHTAQLTCIVSVDIMHDDTELTQAALQALGFCLHLPDISRAFTPEDASTIMKALCNSLLKTKDKSTCTRALWCLSKQNFPPQIIQSEIHSILCALEHSLVQGEFQSMTVEYEAANVIIRLLEGLPDEIPTHAARWGKLLFPLVVHSAHKIRERAAYAMDLGLPALMKHQPEILTGLVAELKTTLVPEMLKLFGNKCEIHVLKMWRNFVTLLGKTLHKGGGLINCLLGVVEQGFKSSSSDVKKASFDSWKVLIDNFAIETDVLYNAKRLKLVLQPLRATNAKQEVVAQAKLDTWWYLVSRLGPKAAMNFDQVCAPLLQFSLALNTNTSGTQCPSTPLVSNGAGLRQGFTTPLHRAGPLFSMASPTTPRLSLPPGTPGSATHPVFKSVQLQGVEMLARILGMPSEAVGTAPNYNFTINSLSHPVITSSTTFIKLSTTLIPLVRDVVCNLGDQLEEGLLFQLWYSLVIHVSDMVTTATKKDSVEVLTQFLSSLQCIVGSSALPPQILLKFLEAVGNLPKNVLGSSSYHTGNAGLLHGTPALFLIELLLSPGLLVRATDERFFCVLETLIDCGLTVPGTVLGFSGSVLNLVDKAASDLSNKELLWRIWSCIVYPLLGHIIETNEVNQGDSLDHDFSTMYASLMLPIQRLLLSETGTLPQMTNKTLLKTWSELYQAFARCAAVVTTADSNLGCEELCTKILTCLESRPLNSSLRVDYLAQILQVIIINFDFTSFTVNTTLQNAHTPGGSRGRIRPLGNLTAIIKLVAKVAEENQRQLKAELSKFAGLLQQSSTSQQSFTTVNTMANIFSTLFTNVSQPSIMAVLLDKLSTHISCFYDSTGPLKSTSYPMSTWQKLEKLWIDLLTSIQTRYNGVYDSAFLVIISSLLEVGLMHSKRAVKNHTLVFWNATFATTDTLDYPESLKVCLAKLKEKTPLVLPGWTDTQFQMVDETPVSQIPESDQSQSLIPPPVATTVPNFGAPSPQKVHGSFLKRTAQAERLVTSSSPKRHLSPFGMITRRGTSPGKGALMGVASPLGGKGKRDASPGVSSGAARRRLHVDEESMGEFVFIAPSPKKTQVLTDHQKEMLRTRRVIPALYNDLEQSQDTQMFSETMSQNEAIQEAPIVGQAENSTEASPSILKAKNREATTTEEAPRNQESVDEVSEIHKDEANFSGSNGECGVDKTGQSETPTEKEVHEDADISNASEPSTISFANFLSKLKEKSQELAPVLTDTSVATDNANEETTVVEAKSFTGCAKESLTDATDSGSPRENKEVLLSATLGNVESSVEEMEIDSCEMVEDLQTKSESDAGVVREREEMEFDDSPKEDEQQVLAKDSTDDEEVQSKRLDTINKPEDDDCIIPETQQSQDASDKTDDDNVFISPTKPISGSKPSEIKLSLTPIIKLQKLNDADLLRLSPDPSKCTFSRLDINSSPKVFTSSEEEPTPKRFTSRLHLLQTDEPHRSTKSLKRAPTSKAKKVQQGRRKKGINKSLQSSQADLAELAERFELDGIQPLDDETDMDQSLDTMTNESQSKEVLDEAPSNDSQKPQEDENNQTRSKGQRKVRGKRKIHVGDTEKTTVSKLSDAVDDKMSSEDCYNADESTLDETIKDNRKDSQESVVPTRAPTVLKKRGRPKKDKKVHLSPAEKASNSQSKAVEEKTVVDSERKECQQKSDLEEKSSAGATNRQEKPQGTTAEEPKDSVPEQESVAEQKHDLNIPKDCVNEGKSLEKETPNESPDEKQESSKSQDDEKNLNSCDDLFESPEVTKDLPQGQTTKNAPGETKSKEESDKSVKRSVRLSQKRIVLGKRKHPCIDCEEDSADDDDNIPLAQIKHCYLDVDSQTSDSEVDFPKKDLEASQVEESSKVTEHEDCETKDLEKSEPLTDLKTKKRGKKRTALSPCLSPKTSPNTAFAKKALKRARKSPLNRKKFSPGKPVVRSASKVSPMATRLRGRKSLSASVPSKPSRKPRRALNGESETVIKNPTNKSKFQEKLDKAKLEEVREDALPEKIKNLLEDLSSVASQSMSLPLLESRGEPLLSSPVNLQTEVTPKEDEVASESTPQKSEIQPSATEQEINTDQATLVEDYILGAENEEILSSSLLGSETVEEPTEVGMECPLDSSSCYSPPRSVPATTEVKTTDFLEPLKECPFPVSRPTLLESPVISVKFAPSSHSSPNAREVAKPQLTNLGSPSGSIPSMYSPSGSPSSGILKRRDASSPSPSNKSRRVSFAEPISEHSPVKQFAVEMISTETATDQSSKLQRVSHPPSPLVTTTPSKVVTVHSKFITTPSRHSSSSSLSSSNSRVSPSGRRISPGIARRRTSRTFITPSSGRKHLKTIRPSSQTSQGVAPSQNTQQNSLDNSIDSDYDNQESVFPDLAECGTPVERILPQLTSSMWSRGLGQLVRARNILTVGNLCSLSPTEIRSLPIRSPKISNLRKVMTNFHKQQMAKEGTSLMSKKREEEASITSESSGGETKAAEVVKNVEEDESETKIAPNRETRVEATSQSKEVTPPSSEDPPRPKPGTKRKRQELDTPEGSDDERPSKPKQARVMDKLEDLVAEFSTERLAELPSDRLFQAHQHVNTLMESIMAALKVKVKSPSLKS